MKNQLNLRETENDNNKNLKREWVKEKNETKYIRNA